MPYISQASIDDRFRDGTTALWVACKVRQCTNAPLHQRDSAPNVPMHQCAPGRYDRQRLCARAPRHPIAPYCTLLHPIAPYCTNAHHQGGAIGCVEALLAARARTTLMTSAGYSCLWIAAREGRTDIVQLLLKERRGLL